MKKIQTDRALLIENQNLKARLKAAEAQLGSAAETEKERLNFLKTLYAVLDGIDAYVYVVDLETYVILYMNARMQADYGGDLTGKLCHQVFRGQDCPCPDCTTPDLIDAAGLPTKGVSSEGQSVLNGRWYLNHDRAIYWPDGRLVRLQIATDITERKKAEGKLRESEAHYRALFENSIDAIHVTNEKDEIIDVNQRMCEMMGYTRDELLSMTIHDLQAPEIRGKAGTIAQNEIERFQGTAFESLNIHRDGHVFPIELTVSKVSSLEGDHYYSILREITERKKIEDALRQNEYLLAEAEKVAGLGSFALDITNGNWTSSKSLRQIFGITADYKTDLDGWLALVHPDDRLFMGDYFSRYVLTQHEDFNRQYRIVRFEDGETRWVHGLGKLEFDQNGNPVRLIGTIQNITDRKQVEDQLRESETRYRSLFHNSPIPQWEQDHSEIKAFIDSLKSKGISDFQAYFDTHPEDALKCLAKVKIIDVNSAALDFHGFCTLAEVRQKYLELRTTDSLGSFADQLVAFASGQPVYEGEILAFNAAGQLKYSLLKAIILPQYQDTWERVYLASVDITSRKQAEEILIQRANEISTLHGLSLDITSTSELPTLLESIIIRTTNLIGYTSGGCLFLIGPEKGQIHCVVSYQTTTDITGQVFNYGEGVAGTVAELEHPIIVNDYRLWEKPIPGVSTPDPSFKILSVPILWQQALVGVIHVFRNETDDNFNQADLEMLELLANHAAIAIENTRMVQEIKSHTADLEERVADRTAELQILVDAMIGREARMADLKDVIRKLRKQIESTGMTPIADDPLKQ